MIEDQLKAAMVAHDIEAPDGSRLVVPTAVDRPSRRGQLATGIAVAAVMVLVIGTFGYRSSLSGHSSSKPLANSPATASKPPSTRTVPQCPVLPKDPGVDPWVPAKPQGVDGSSRLAPLQTPVRALVCAYIGPHSPAGKTGSVVLTGDLSGIPTDLAWAPPVFGSGGGCTDNLLVTDGDYYLIGLSYPTGVIWVSAPANHCAGSGNGTFTSPANYSGQARQWYQAGRWVADSPTPPCQQAAGRLGQQSQLVPPGASSIAICDGDGHQLGRSHPIADADRLVEALNALSSSPSQSMCVPVSSSADTSSEYRLYFHYVEGRSVLIDVLPNCQPAILGGSLQASDASTIVPLVAALIAAR